MQDQTDTLTQDCVSVRKNCASVSVCTRVQASLSTPPLLNYNLHLWALGRFCIGSVYKAKSTAKTGSDSERYTSSCICVCTT